MTRIVLTDRKVKNIDKPAEGQEEHWDALVPGLALRVTYTGTRSWVVVKRASVGGKKKLHRETLGRYPQLSLEDARERAREILVLIEAGDDPKATKAAQKIAKVADNKNTFENVRNRFLAAKSKKLKPRTLEFYGANLGDTHFEGWNNFPLKAITRAQVRAQIDGIEEEISASVAFAVFSSLRAMFNWAVEKDILTTAPTDRMEGPDGSDKRKRVLSDDELRIAWTALSSAGIFEIPYKLLILTGQRREEIVALRRDELYDLDTDAPYILLSESRTKNGLPHTVPLAPLSAELVRRALTNCQNSDGNPYVFSTTGKTPLSGYSRVKNSIDKEIVRITNAELTTVRNAGDMQRLVQLGKAFPSERREARILSDIAAAEAAGDAGAAARLATELEMLDVDPTRCSWRLHDFRRTLVTGMNNQMIDPHIVEIVVNHVSGSVKDNVAGVYNYAQYLPQRRSALEVWAKYIESLVQSDQVVEVTLN
ncbi:tyrosine-type recombinase/integrase [Paraburkholderia adhaesiva]|uniref:tyrosine-type recombinase/integrase n=1 Tax=Paraburkholderia adhaesiva TaxID=2883244 RepID=UPI001F25677A|nr:integrase family protein [Paraburkholderia adhaesiva]